MSENSHPWQQSMPEDQFTRMRDILAAPSPVGLEAAMTEGVLAPMCESFMPEGWSYAFPRQRRCRPRHLAGRS